MNARLITRNLSHRRTFRHLSTRALHSQQLTSMHVTAWLGEA
jgi:hypothetical protein